MFESFNVPGLYIAVQVRAELFKILSDSWSILMCFWSPFPLLDVYLGTLLSSRYRVRALTAQTKPPTIVVVG